MLKVSRAYRMFKMGIVTKNICMQAFQVNNLDHGSQGGSGQCLETFWVVTVGGTGTTSI